MKLQTLRRNGGIATAAIALSLTLAACGSEGDTETATGTDETSEAAPEETPAEEPTEAEASAADQTFGEGCAAVPADGAGSFDGMVMDPVATAASNNPLLSTLVTAVGEADLVGTLNDAPDLTVFAPVNDAFAAIPEADLNGILADKALLTKILTHHVIGGQLDPAAVVGEQETLNKDTLTVKGDETGMTVTDGVVTANVICGNVPTANATVYIIDAVMAGAK
ncbi:lipoprotein [Nocardioides psychrotolerans]|uniref:Uncaracterized surface protein containing fasciclin (FAS1) repeats n=1 Tax=Nocardioides psychrotolerans TaxID=1005945 RepID=A0A1I3EC52_9ACTN|nr:fasciclin domain-containing protein [Nocardioides psychrotolerans]GEP37430.1 lipoprotein [Nocardioides psychrotolerans]SFH96546.1 Uncaracterized surface protein containing fasciclin (FAS1) repeats [Nocardioides psychrotolerans]